MTHLLIPLADVNHRIRLMKNLITIETRDKKEGWERLVNETENMIELYTGLLKFKQISFDEKDIEEKAEEVASKSYKTKLIPMEVYKANINQRLGFFEGYQKALKDLL